MTVHPLWPTPIGKQRVGEPRSTKGFLGVIRLVNERLKRGDNIISGTYEWQTDHWQCLTEIGLSDFPDCVCPVQLPGDIEITDPDEGQQ